MKEEPRWLRNLRFWGGEPRSEVEDELTFHLEERIRLNLARGLTPEQARADAERRFGDIDAIRSRCITEQERTWRRAAMADRVGEVARDVRLAVRSLVRARVYTVAVVVALALGVGANTAAFTVLRAVLFQPLPYAAPERVVAVYTRWEGMADGRLSPAEYLDHAERNRAFSALGVYANGFANVVEGDAAERVAAVHATPSVFAALGVVPAAGRLYTDADAGGEAVVVISHEYWQRRFGGAMDMPGRGVVINGVSRTIIGVLPADVRLPAHYAETQAPAVFLPYLVDRSTDPPRGSHFLFGVARVAPGWTVESANAEVARIAHEMTLAHPDDYPESMRFGSFVRPVHAVVVGDARRLLLILAAAVALVLVIACANVSSLILTRTEDRRREFAVRSALGAGRWRIRRQLLLEHAVLALLAAVAAVVLAVAGVRTLVLLQPGDIPRLAEAVVDGRALVYTMVLAVAATLLAAVAPLRFGAPAYAALREAGGRSTPTKASHRTRRVLIGSEVALSVVLLVGAGLLLRSLANLIAVDPGYRTEQRLTVPVALPTADYPDDETRRRFFEQLVTDASDLSGVIAAGAVANLPLASPTGDLNIQLEGRTVAPTDVSPRLDWQVVTPGWFDAMGVEIIRGRGITALDAERAPGAVVLSESAARKYWPGTDPIGQRFLLGAGAGPGWVTVVGIARDVRQSALTDEPPAVMYLAHAQFTFWGGGAAVAAMTLVLHTAAEPLALVPTVRELVRRLDPHVALGAVRTMDQVAGTAVAKPRFAASVLGGFALLALVLAMVGIYGLVAYTVARRTREIAVRMALGADGAQVVRQIMLQAMHPVLAGAAVGGVCAFILGRGLQSMLYRVPPHDPVALAGALLLLLGTAFVASLLPSRRAAAVPPLTAMRDG